MPVVPHDGGPGVSGAAGAAGSLAVSGTAGDTATAGSGGAAGDSSSGTAGVSPMGTAGDPGAAGASGTAGDPGTAGAGTAGDPGVAGTSGTAGDPGAAGAGTAGAQGTAGAGTAGAGGAGGGGGKAGMMGTAGTGGAGGGGQPACGPKTCPSGCCDSTGKCVGGRANDHCGSGGGACVACGNNCLFCNTSGACDVDPSSVWDVICVQATVKATMPNGQTWDPPSSGPNGTNPDPFCQFEMPTNTVNPQQARSSSTIPDSFTPVWNADVTPASKPIKASDLMSTSKTWRLWVGDDDGCTVRGCVGQEICEIDQPLPSDALVSGQLVKQNLASCLSLTVKFVCAQ
jgi:hypothetical protein